jgi:hypothetical protein
MKIAHVVNRRVNVIACAEKSAILPPIVFVNIFAPIGWRASNALNLVSVLLANPKTLSEGNILVIIQ